MKRTAILTVILLAALSLSGFAQDIHQPGPKSKEKATALAFSGIVIPVVGPGFGHLYAGQYGQFFRGATIRGVCAGAGLVFGGYLAFSWACSDGPNPVLMLAVIACGGGYLWSSIHDIATANNSVEKYNRKHGFTGKIQLTPTYMPDKKAVGLALTANF